MASEKFDFSLAIGGAAGQGIAAPGDVLAWIFVQRGLHIYTYNATNPSFAEVTSF